MPTTLTEEQKTERNKFAATVTVALDTFRSDSNLISAFQDKRSPPNERGRDEVRKNGGRLDFGKNSLNILKYSNLEPSAKATVDLILALDAEKVKYKKGDIELPQFEKNCNKLIEGKRNTIEMAPGVVNALVKMITFFKNFFNGKDAADTFREKNMAKTDLADNFKVFKAKMQSQIQEYKDVDKILSKESENENKPVTPRLG